MTVKVIFVVILVKVASLFMFRFLLVAATRGVRKGGQRAMLKKLRFSVNTLLQLLFSYVISFRGGGGFG